jgi:Ca2+-binding RTX toxin-like protein
LTDFHGLNLNARQGFSKMANYTLYGTGKNMFDAVNPVIFEGVLLSEALLYVSPTEFGILNKDGSKTFFTGTGFVFDDVSGTFTDGTITAVAHYTNGLFTDRLTGVDIPASFFGQTLFGENIAIFAFLESNDVLDARSRAGGAVLPVTLNGYGGNDSIFGGSGADTLIGGYGLDTIRGYDGNDLLIGDLDGSFVGSGVDGNDSLSGGNGDDKVSGGAGNDVMSGDAGNDILFGGDGKDRANGGTGIDTVIYETSFARLAIVRTTTGFTVTANGVSESLTVIERIATDTGTYEFNATTGTWTRINGTAGVELFDRTTTQTGTAGDDVLDAFNNLVRVIKGLGGNDRIVTAVAEGQGTLVFGGDGNDTIEGFGRLYGGNGNDVISGNGEIYGGAGNDLLATKDGNDTVSGDSGTDSALFFESFDGLIGTKTAKGFTVETRTGLDSFSSVERLVVDEGTYAINFATGTLTRISDVSANETLDPNARINGTESRDVISLINTDKSVAYALGGDDEIQGGALGDLIFGGAGNDSISGDFSAGLGQFTSSGDRLYGGDGNDSLGGGRGNDKLYGGNGDDIVAGGSGSDQLSGGAGADRFSFFYSNDRFNQQDIGNDVITDFEVGVDKLEFSYRIIQPPGVGSETLRLTAEGWLVETNRGGSVLLEGVTTAGLTLDDLVA